MCFTSYVVLIIGTLFKSTQFHNLNDNLMLLKRIHTLFMLFVNIQVWCIWNTLSLTKYLVLVCLVLLDNICN